jgi:hypothetical protein
MLASTGKMVQYANEEYRRWKNHEFSESDESNDNAFARAKQNRFDAYSQINRIKTKAVELREADLQLQAETQAEQLNTTTANALKAILK